VSRWIVQVECEANSYADARNNVEALVNEANETTYGLEPVYIVGAKEASE